MLLENNIKECLPDLWVSKLFLNMIKTLNIKAKLSIMQH